MVLPYLAIQYGEGTRACPPHIVYRLRLGRCLVVPGVAKLIHRAVTLLGTKMSGKSFRVSDGDWICPDKK